MLLLSRIRQWVQSSVCVLGRNGLREASSDWKSFARSLSHIPKQLAVLPDTHLGTTEIRTRSELFSSWCLSYPGFQRKRRQTHESETGSGLVHSHGGLGKGGKGWEGHWRTVCAWPAAFCHVKSYIIRCKFVVNSNHKAKKVVGPEIHLYESWKSIPSFQPEFPNGSLIPLCSCARSLSLSLKSSFLFLMFILQLYLQRVTVSPLRLGSTWLNKPLSFNFLL